MAQEPVGYDAAIAAMQERVAAIRAYGAPEQVWLLEHPPLYTAGTSAKPADLEQPDRFPTHAAGRGGQWTYHGPGQLIAYVMLDLTRPHGGVPTRDTHAYVAALENWLIITLATFGVRGGKAQRPGGRVGNRQPDGGREQSGSCWRADYPLGDVARRLAERMPRAGSFCRHRAMRHTRAWRDEPARAGRGSLDG